MSSFEFEWKSRFRSVLISPSPSRLLSVLRFTSTTSTGGGGWKISWITNPRCRRAQKSDFDRFSLNFCTFCSVIFSRVKLFGIRFQEINFEWTLASSSKIDSTLLISIISFLCCITFGWIISGSCDTSTIFSSAFSILFKSLMILKQLKILADYLLKIVYIKIYTRFDVIT